VAGREGASAGAGDGGWGWFEPSPPPPAGPGPELRRAFLACFSTPEGEVVLAHLRRVFLDRRVAPNGPDAELRHVEGQRSVVAHVLGLLERARDRQEDRC
jgi:hypothetical protein